MTDIQWTTERVDLLKNRWGAGLSAGTIAREIGTTRNSICGKVHRLGLARRSPVPPPKRRARKPRPIHLASRPGTHPAPQPGIGPTSHQDRSAAGGATMTQPSPPMRSVDRLSIELPSCATPLLDLAPHGCRWPGAEDEAGRHLFCGTRQVDGLPYCAGHSRMSYVPGSARNRPAEPWRFRP